MSHCPEHPNRNVALADNQNLRPLANEAAQTQEMRPRESPF